FCTTRSASAQSMYPDFTCSCAGPPWAGRTIPQLVPGPASPRESDASPVAVDVSDGAVDRPGSDGGSPWSPAAMTSSDCLPDCVTSPTVPVPARTTPSVASRAPTTRPGRVGRPGAVPAQSVGPAGAGPDPPRPPTTMRATPAAAVSTPATNRMSATVLTGGIFSPSSCA